MQIDKELKNLEKVLKKLRKAESIRFRRELKYEKSIN